MCSIRTQKKLPGMLPREAAFRGAFLRGFERGPDGSNADRPAGESNPIAWPKPEARHQSRRDHSSALLRRRLQLRRLWLRLRLRLAASWLLRRSAAAQLQLCLRLGRAAAALGLQEKAQNGEGEG